MHVLATYRGENPLDERAVIRKRPAAAIPQDETAVKKVKAASTPMKKHPSSPAAAMPTPPKPFFGVERPRMAAVHECNIATNDKQNVENTHKQQQ